MLIFGFIFAVVFFLLMLAFLIVQLVFGYISEILPSIATLIMSGAILYSVFRYAKRKSFPKKANISVDRTSNKLWINRLVAGVLCVLLCGGGYLFYRLAYQNVVSSGADLVEARIVSQEPLVEREIYVDSDEVTEKVYVECKVTFSYELDGETYELVHVFRGIEKINSETLKIYVFDNTFVATELQPKVGRLMAIYFFVLAGLNFLLMLVLAGIPVIVFGDIFAATFGIFTIAFQITFKDIFFSLAGFGSVITALTICGLFLIFAGLIQGIHDLTHIQETKSVQSKKRAKKLTPPDLTPPDLTPPELNDESDFEE